MRIVVTNVYSYKNKGDAAIVLALVQEARRVFPGADLLLQTADIRHDVDKYGAPISATLLWILLSSQRDAAPWRRVWVAGSGWLGLVIFLCCAKWLRVRPRFLLSKALRQFVDEQASADMVIACGGGYLRTAGSGPRDVVLLATTCLNFLAAKYLGTKVFLYSQSIGPVHGRLQRAMLRFALNRVDLIEPREDVSVKFLQELRPRAPIVQTTDPALLLGGNGKFPTGKVRLTPGRLHVGLTVRKWFKASEQRDAYIDAVAQTIDHLIEQHRAEVFYVPQVIADNFGDDDRVVAREVWRRVKNQKYFTLVEADLHPFEMIGLCGKMDIFIGTRMHSNIFALINHVPVVAIEYEHKTRGIMRGLGLEPLTIDIKDVSFTSLEKKVATLLGSRAKYVRLIEKNMPGQLAQSRKAMEATKEVYEAKATG